MPAREVTVKVQAQGFQQKSNLNKLEAAIYFVPYYFFVEFDMKNIRLYNAYVISIVLVLLFVACFQKEE